MPVSASANEVFYVREYIQPPQDFLMDASDGSSLFSPRFDFCMLRVDPRCAKAVEYLSLQNGA